MRSSPARKRRGSLRHRLHDSELFLGPHGRCTPTISNARSASFKDTSPLAPCVQSFAATFRHARYSSFKAVGSRSSTRCYTNLASIRNVEQLQLWLEGDSPGGGCPWTCRMRCRISNQPCPIHRHRQRHLPIAAVATARKSRSRGLEASLGFFVHSKRTFADRQRRYVDARYVRY